MTHVAPNDNDDDDDDGFIRVVSKWRPSSLAPMTVIMTHADETSLVIPDKKFFKNNKNKNYYDLLRAVAADRDDDDADEDVDDEPIGVASDSGGPAIYHMDENQPSALITAAVIGSYGFLQGLSPKQFCIYSSSPPDSRFSLVKVTLLTIVFVFGLLLMHFKYLNSGHYVKRKAQVQNEVYDDNADTLDKSPCCLFRSRESTPTRSRSINTVNACKVMGLFLSTFIRCAHSISPNPNPYYIMDHHGVSQGPIYLKGSFKYSWEEDEEGFTVLPVGNRSYYYAKQDAITGDLIATTIPIRKKEKNGLVGSSPLSLGVTRHEKASEKIRRQKCGDCYNAKGHGRELQRTLVSTMGTLKNLMVLFRFKDHTTRSLPSKAAIDVLMNHQGDGVNVAYHALAPTGSVRYEL